MKKLALFVEGQTEQIFAEKFLIEVAQKNNIQIEKLKLNSCNRIAFRSINKQKGNSEYFILIVDCTNDERVTSAIRDNYLSLCSQKYDSIVGLRDLYPTALSALGKTKNGVRKLLLKQPKAQVFFAVSEIETWFIAEYSHFKKIDKKLTDALISQKLGVDITTLAAESIQHASAFLNKIYALAGKAYKKDRKRVERTVNAIDYVHMYVSVPPRVNHLKEFVSHIDTFFS